MSLGSADAADVTEFLLRPAALEEWLRAGPASAVAAGVLRGLVERLALLVRQHTAARDGRQEGYAKALRAVAAMASRVAQHLQCSLPDVLGLPLDLQRLLVLSLVEGAGPDGQGPPLLLLARWALHHHGRPSWEAAAPLPELPFPGAAALPGTPEELSHYAAVTVEEHLKEAPAAATAAALHFELAEFYYGQDRFAEAQAHLLAAQGQAQTAAPAGVGLAPPDGGRLRALLLGCALALRPAAGWPGVPLDDGPSSAPTELGNFLECERARAEGRLDRLVRCVMVDVFAGLAGGYASGDRCGLLSEEYRGILQQTVKRSQRHDLRGLELWCVACGGQSPDDVACLDLCNGAVLISYLRKCRLSLTAVLPGLALRRAVDAAEVRRRLGGFLERPQARSAAPGVFAAVVLAYAPEVAAASARADVDRLMEPTAADATWGHRLRRLPKAVQGVLLAGSPRRRPADPASLPASPPSSPAHRSAGHSALSPGLSPEPLMAADPGSAPARSERPPRPAPAMTVPPLASPGASPASFLPAAGVLLHHAKRCFELGQYQPALDLFLRLQTESYSVEAEHWLLLCKARLALEVGDAEEWDGLAAQLTAQALRPSLPCTAEILTALSAAKPALRAYCSAVVASGGAGEGGGLALCRFVDKLLYFQRLSKAPSRELEPRVFAATFGELLDLLAGAAPPLLSLCCRALTWYRLPNVMFQACAAIVKATYQCSWEPYKEGLIGPPFDVLDRLLVDVAYRLDAPRAARLVGQLHQLCCHRLYLRFPAPLYSWLLADVWLKQANYEQAYAHYLLGLDPMYPTDDRHILAGLIRCCEVTHRWAEAALLVQFRLPPSLPAAARLLLLGLPTMDPALLEFVCEAELLELLWVRAAQAGDAQRQAALMAAVQRLPRLHAVRPQLKGRFLAHLREGLR